MHCLQRWRAYRMNDEVLVVHYKSAVIRWILFAGALRDSEAAAVFAKPLSLSAPAREFLPAVI